MNNLKTLFLASVVAIAALFTACTTDPVEPLSPTLSIELTANLGAAQDSIAVDSFFTVNVLANSGSNPLTRIEVRENGTAIDISRLDFNGFPAGSNPSPLGASDSSTLDWVLKVQAPSDPGTNDYSIIIRDAIDSTVERSFSVTAFVPFTAVDTNTMVLRLRNQDGDDGQGGLDLDTGMETGTVAVTDTIHDLEDLGIDIFQPIDWIQKFKASNGAELRKIDNSFDFDGVQFKEQVTAAFENGTPIAAETDVVQVGDMFAVKVAAGTIYLLHTDEVTVTPVPGENDDFYIFSSKF